MRIYNASHSIYEILFEIDKKKVNKRLSKTVVHICDKELAVKDIIMPPYFIDVNILKLETLNKYITVMDLCGVLEDEDEVSIFMEKEESYGKAYSTLHINKSTGKIKSKSFHTKY